MTDFHDEIPIQTPPDVRPDDADTKGPIPENEPEPLKHGDQVTFEGRLCEITAVHQNGLVDVQEIVAAGAARRWYQNIGPSQLTRVADV